MRALWGLLTFGALGAPVLGLAYWAWYRLSSRDARARVPPGVVVLVTSLFVSATCFTVGAIAYVLLVST